MVTRQLRRPPSVRTPAEPIQPHDVDGITLGAIRSERLPIERFHVGVDENGIPAVYHVEHPVFQW
jgi:hypothetical protein